MAVGSNLNESIQLLGSFIQAENQKEMQERQLSFQAGQQDIQNRQQQLMAAIENARQRKNMAMQMDFQVREGLARIGQTAYDSGAKDMVTNISGSLRDEAESSEDIASAYEKAYQKNLNVMGAGVYGAQFGQSMSYEDMKEFINSKDKRAFIEERFKDESDKYTGTKEKEAFLKGIMSSVNESTISELELKKQNIKNMKEQIALSTQQRLESHFNMNRNAYEIKKNVIADINAMGEEEAQSLMIGNAYGSSYEKARIDAMPEGDDKKRQLEQYEAKKSLIYSDAENLSQNFATAELFGDKAGEYSQRMYEYYSQFAEDAGSDPNGFLKKNSKLISEVQKHIERGGTMGTYLSSLKDLDKKAKVLALFNNKAFGSSTSDRYETLKMAIKGNKIRDEFLKKASDSDMKSYQGIDEFSREFSEAYQSMYEQEELTDVSKLIDIPMNNNYSNETGTKDGNPGSVANKYLPSNMPDFNTANDSIKRKIGAVALERMNNETSKLESEAVSLLNNVSKLEFNKSNYQDIKNKVSEIEGLLESSGKIIKDKRSFFSDLDVRTSASIRKSQQEDGKKKAVINRRALEVQLSILKNKLKEIEFGLTE